MDLRRGAVVLALLAVAGSVAAVSTLGDSETPSTTAVAEGPAQKARGVLDAAVAAAGGGRPDVEMLRAAAAGVAVVTADEDRDGDGFDDDGRVQLNVDGDLQCLLVPTADTTAFVGVANGMCVIGGAQVASSLPAETTVPATSAPPAVPATDVP